MENVDIEFYKGTEYVTLSIAMCDPYYKLSGHSDYFIPIIQTQNGYFIIDLSSMKAGTYVLSAYKEYSTNDKTRAMYMINVK